MDYLQNVCKNKRNLEKSVNRNTKKRLYIIIKNFSFSCNFNSRRQNCIHFTLSNDHLHFSIKSADVL